MGKIAFVFPGQGAQTVGMGKDVYEHSEIAKEIFDKASEAVGLDLKALCFEENENIHITEFTQVCLLTTSVAIMEVLRARGVKPDVAAGLSLGEYCALVAAESMNYIDAARAVRKRGIFMQEEVPAGEGAMAAILGMDAGDIEKIIADMDKVQIANYNCPGQIVITGEEAAVAAAGEACKEAGAKRVVPLKVSGPFHSKMLAGAGEKLGKELEHVTVNTPQIPYLTNVTADYVTDSSQVKELLEQQVSSSVRWQQSVERMIADGVDEFVEIGPGKTLSGFMKKINKEVKVCNIDKMEDFERFVSEHPLS